MEAFQSHTESIPVKKPISETPKLKAQTEAPKKILNDVQRALAQKIETIAQAM